MLDLKI